MRLKAEWQHDANGCREPLERATVTMHRSKSVLTTCDGSNPSVIISPLIIPKLASQLAEELTNYCSRLVELSGLILNSYFCFYDGATYFG